MKKLKAIKLEIPAHAYINSTAPEQIQSESDQLWETERLTWSDGIRLYLVNAEYPQKGLTSPAALWAINIVKSIFMEPVKVLAHTVFYPSMVFFLIYPRKVQFLQKLLESFNQLSNRVISPILLKEDYLTPIAQQLDWVLYTFLYELGIDSKVAQQFAQIFCHIIEYDTAYRYRLGDLFSETTKTKLMDNPRKEIRRLLKIHQKRDTKVVSHKFTKTAQILSILLLSPRIKRAFRIAIDAANMTKLQFDEGDRYWVCLREDYNYMGLTNEERKKLLEGKKIPKTRSLEEVQRQYILETSLSNRY